MCIRDRTATVSCNEEKGFLSNPQFIPSRDSAPVGSKIVLSIPADRLIAPTPKPFQLFAIISK